MKRSRILIALSLALIVLLALGGTTLADTYRVRVREAHIFSEKDGSSEILDTLKGPAKVEVVAIEGDWAEVVTYEWFMVNGTPTQVGTTGYMYASCLTGRMLAAEGMTGRLWDIAPVGAR